MSPMPSLHLAVQGVLAALSSKLSKMETSTLITRAHIVTALQITMYYLDRLWEYVPAVFKMSLLKLTSPIVSDPVLTNSTIPRLTNPTQFSLFFKLAALSNQ